MTSSDDETHPIRRCDKQLEGISLDAVMEKRCLDQALNAKEFAVSAWHLLFDSPKAVLPA